MSRILVTLFVAVVVGAAALPLGSVGIGWVLCALAIGAVAVAARSARDSVPTLPPTPATARYPGPLPVATPVLATPSIAPAVTPAVAPTVTPAVPPAVTPAFTSTVAPAVAPAVPPAVTPAVTPAATPTVPPAVTPGVTPAGTTAVVAESPAAGSPPVIAPILSPAPAVPAPIALAAPAPPPSTVDRAWRYAAGASALLLMAVPAVRASDILTFLCLTAALPVASYALVGGRTWLRLFLAAVSFIPGAVLGLQWLATYRPRSRKSDQAGGVNPLRVVAAIGVSLLLALILIPLLRSADVVFANLLDSWTDQFPQLDGRFVGGAIIVAFIGVATAFLAHRGASAARSATLPGRFQVAGLEWIMPILVVDVIFGIFVAVQIQVLFGGHAYVLGAGGPDYAQYARGGSGQLGFVAALALILAAGFGVLAKRESARHRVWIRTAGGLLCVLTLVIVASAVRRLALYVDAYGFTWLRLLGMASEVWLGLVFVLLLAAGVRLRGAWLPRATAATAVAVLFALVAVNPEALIARTTLERLGGPYGVDFSYVDNLSADAVDEILALPPGVRDCALDNLRYDLSRPDRWYQFNLTREHARTALATVAQQACQLPPGSHR